MIEHFAIGVAIGALVGWVAFRLASRDVPDEPDYWLDDPYLVSLLFCEDCGPVADVGHHPDCRRAAA
jgi:hypothetical protein